MAERLRAGGAGIPAFFTATVYGTIVAEGKETREFDDKHYVMETAQVADLSLVKAWKADKTGNLIFRETVAEVEDLVGVGDINPDQVHCRAPTSTASWSTPREKRIEQLTVREER